ncbi:hypothetical protein TNCV_3782741 [Trichonephila clavipes]|nr:hypothetical protein TNCV_3782741 [Trichonephila clavipes]
MRNSLLCSCSIPPRLDWHVSRFLTEGTFGTAYRCPRNSSSPQVSKDGAPSHYGRIMLSPILSYVIMAPQDVLYLPSKFVHGIRRHPVMLSSILENVNNDLA